MKIYPKVGHGFDDQEVWRNAAQRSLSFLQKYLTAPENP
jgi:hypothetical protein